MGGIAEYKEPLLTELPKQPEGIWGNRPTISPMEGKEVLEVPPIPQATEAGLNTLDFIFENLRRSNYASANTFDKLYDNLSLLKAEGDKGVGIPGILQNLKKGDWNLAESAWKGFTGEEKKTFADLAEKGGIPFPKVTGFVGDVVLDPLTYIPASWFKSVFKAVGITKVGEKIKGTKGAGLFIPGAGLPEEYYTSKLFAKYSLSNEEKKIIDEIYILRKGLGKDARESLTKLRSLSYDPIATAKEIEGLVEEGKITVKDIYKLNQIGDRFDTIGQRSVDEGLISKGQFDTWKGSYWPGLTKERVNLGSPDVMPNFFEKASKGGFFTKHKHFRDIDEYDDFLKSIGVKEGAERDILKLLAYREVTEARFLVKKKFVDLTLKRFGIKLKRNPYGGFDIPSELQKQAIESGITNPKVSLELGKPIPEGYGMYLPKGAIRIFTKEYLEPKFISSLDDLAEKLKELRIKSEKVTTTKTTTEATLPGAGPSSTGPRAKMEAIVRGALTYRGFTEGEANAYINILSTKGKEGVEELVKTITEKSETIKSMVDSMPIEQSLLDLSSLTEAQVKTIGAITRKVPTYLLPKEIAGDLNKINKFFIGDQSTNWFLSHIIDKPLSVWKSMATAYRLPFHLRNFSSNMFLMFEGDVSPALIPVRLLEAGSIQSGAIKEMTINNNKVNKEILNKFGVLGGHGWLGEQSSTKFTEEIDSILKYGRAKNFNPLNYPKEFGSFIESNSRIGLFLDQLHKGKTVEEAALHVKKYLFNYDELTQFERNVMKRTIPFYTWWRKNIPLQIEMLATKPGKLSTAAKGLDALSGEETPGERKARPEYFDDMGFRKTPDFLNLKDEKGNPIYFCLDMPYNDLLMFDKDISKVFTQVYGGLSPQKMALEIAMNVKAFPKVSQIEKFKGQRVPAPSYIGILSEQLSKVPMVGQQIIKQMGIEPIIDKNTGLKVLGMSALWKHGIETSFPFLSEMGKMYPQPIKLEEENAPWRKWSYMLGVKVIPLNIDMQNKMKQIEKMGKSNEFMKRLENIGRSPTSQELNDFMKEINK